MHAQLTTHGPALARRGLAGALVAVTTIAILFVWLQPAGSRPVPVIDAAFCVLAPVAAHASAQDAANVQLTTAVPLETPPDGSMPPRSVAATQGDVVRVSVVSPRAGGVAVHGLLDVRPIAAGGAVTVEFRAIYSGRFPVHFHGADGSHFEIAAIEVMPAPK